jgi:lipopolysaccharide export system protein LptC
MVDVGAPGPAFVSPRAAAGRENPALPARDPRDPFVRAMRHSQRVRRLRKLIPLACGGAVAVFLVAPFLNPLKAVPENVSVGAISLQGSKLTMEQPKVSGFKKDSKAYEMVAETASQDVKTPNLVEMKSPVARIEMEKGSWARMSAERGLYDSTTEKLVVNENVNVKTDSGMEMRLRQANVDLKAGTVVSTQPVEVDLPNGWIKADTLQIKDNGKIAVFEGRVRSEFRDVEPPTAGTTAAGPQQ